MKKIIINFLKLAVYIFVILDTFYFDFITNEIIKNIFMVIAILCIIYDIWDIAINSYRKRSKGINK